jgi:hypothetical protein
MRGKRGRLRVAKLTLDGFERVERLLPVVMLQGTAEPLHPTLADELLHAPMRDEVTGGQPESIDALPTSADMDDAAAELLVDVQREVDEAEQQRFEKATLQAHRFLEDRILVQKRRRADLEHQLEEARTRRDAAIGSDARAAAEGRVTQLDQRLSDINDAVEKLERRDNVTFQRFHERIHKRRYSPPTLGVLFEVELVVE